ncbi:MAG: aldo/keto reductase [Planctomycetes bacterium]|nr:aldo/keto reductase [Planctomycetota bacterium]
MQYLTLPGTDLRISRLCYGGVSWGTAVRGDAMDRLLNAFRDLGGNFFDTAHCYSFWVPGGTGASELALGDYFRRNGREGMVVATKGGHKSEPGYRRVDRHLSAGRIAADIDDSLARLDIDTIDLYWLHRDDTRVPAGEVVETLNAEVKRGRIRFLGASNWSMARIDDANAYARSHNLRGFTATQPEWSLGAPDTAGRAASTMRFHDDDDRRRCELQKFPVIPYTPTAGGYFGSDGQRAKQAFDNPTGRARLARVQQLAGELGRSNNQIALAYLTSHTFPVIPILGTTNADHMRDAAAATELKLSAQQVAWLRDG